MYRASSFIFSIKTAPNPPDKRYTLCYNALLISHRDNQTRNLVSLVQKCDLFRRHLVVGRLFCSILPKPRISFLVLAHFVAGGSLPLPLHCHAHLDLRPSLTSTCKL